MKTLLKYTLIVLLFTSGFVSCKTDLLEPIPRTAISDLTAFDTRDRIINQVYGFYNAAKSGLYLGGRYQVYNDIRGDEYLNLGQNGVTNLATWNHTLNSQTNEVQNLWGQVYLTINRINVFIDGMQANKATIMEKSLVTDAEFNQFIGEALAMRALAYHNLAMLYARPYTQDPNGLGLILRITAQKSSADNDMARATIGETYAQILKDLNEAESLLPTLTAGTANNANTTTRLHKNSVIALKSRVYLHMGDWAKVIQESNKLVPASAPYISATGVANGLNAAFATAFANYTTAESMFSIPNSATELPGTQNGLAHYFSAATVGNNEYPLNPTGAIWSDLTNFPLTDARRVLTKTAVIGGVTYTFIDKYKAFPHTDWAPVIRYAEVLLNLAEAEAKANGVNARALDLLNAVYLRSNPTATAYTAADFATADAFVNRVLAERGIEFLGEGLRNGDIMRNKLPFGAKGSVGEVAITSSAYVWPIPQSELNTNLKVVQNN